MTSLPRSHDPSERRPCLCEGHRLSPTRGGSERSFAADPTHPGMYQRSVRRPSMPPGTHNQSLEPTRLARAKIRLVLPVESP
jgi:hypothetical protein